MDAAAGAGAGDDRRQSRKRKQKSATTILSLDHDIICIIFSLTNFFDIARCSTVCKSWNLIISRSKLLHKMYMEKQGFGDPSSSLVDSESSLVRYMERQAMQHHRSSLCRGSVFVDQWKGHAVGIDQCRMMMGFILTGVGDKVMRLWSLENYKCLEEYSLPNTSPLVDYDFDENKIVGLVGTRIGIWRRNGTRTRSIFPSREGTFTKGLCMRYMDPDAVVGCKDGTVHIFDMYSKKCSQVIKVHPSPVTCLSLGEDQLIISGSSLGSISVSDPSIEQQVAELKLADLTGIRTICYNPSSQLVFAGSTAGVASCWDLRKMEAVWEKRVSPNVVYSMQHLPQDKSTLVVGGIDGVLRVLDQNTGDVLSSYVMDDGRGASSSCTSLYGKVERKKVKRLSDDSSFDNIPKSLRPTINCLVVGMKKVVTTHNGKYIRVWKFDKPLR